MSDQAVRDLFEMACPNCGSDEDIAVVITTLANLSAEGTEPVGDHDWGDDSPCLCKACDFTGVAAAFNVNNQKQPT